MRQAELIDGNIKTWVLGRAGENKATEVRIDITQPPYSEWVAQTPGGTWGILNAIPDDEVVYFVTVTQPSSGNQYVSWVVKDVDIPKAGRGAMEVVYTGPTPAGSTDTASVSKSELYYTSIQDSLGTTQDFPPAYVDWLNRVAQLAEQAKAAAQAIQDMGVAAITLETGSPASVTKTIDAQGVVTLTFGLPKGNTGSQGPRGISISSITTARVGSGTRITITLDDGTSTYYDVSDGAVTSVDGETGAIKSKNIVDQVNTTSYRMQYVLNSTDGLLHIVGTENT